MTRAGKVFILAAAMLAFGQLPDVSAQRKPTRKPARAVIRGGVYEAPPPARSLPPDVQRRVDTFEKVWQTLRDGYFDPTFNSLDWNKIKTEFAPRARAAKSDAEVHKLLGEMIGRLQRSHLAIIPPEIFLEIEKAKNDAKERERARRARELEADSGSPDDGSEEPLNVDDPLSEYGTGIHLRLIDNKFVIARLDKDSAAEYAGLKTGFVIDSINDVSLSMLLAKLQVYSSNSGGLRRYLPFEIVKYFLNGEKDSQVKIVYLNEKDETKDISIRRERMRSQTVSLGSNFPDTQLTFETVSLNPEVGLIRFNHFAVGVIEKFCDALTEFKNKKAIVIDLRGNLGGSMAAVMGLRGMLSDRDVELGTAIYRSGSENLTAQSKAKNFRGRLVVLVDGMTASAAEMLSSSLQDSRRALVVGDRTAGETLPAITVDLPTGARLLYPVANYRSAAGKFLEGNGISPDKLVSLDRKSLLLGHDVQVDTALRLIGDDAAFGKLASPQADMQFLAKPPPDFVGPVNTGGVPPPPPPPIRKEAPLKLLGEVTIKAPPPRPAIVKPVARDTRALRVIGDFAATAGSPEAFAKIKNYTITGRLELQMKGVRQLFDYKVYRIHPDKYAEITTSAGTGEIRSIHDGKVMHITTDFGFDKKMPAPPATVGDMEYLAPIARIKDVAEFPKVEYLGIFDRSGRKVHLIQAEAKSGDTVALSFDVESKMLTGIASDSATISYSDFRKVGDLTLPFHVESGSSMTMSLDEIKLNTEIDASVFQPQDRCFDKP